MTQNPAGPNEALSTEKQPSAGEIHAKSIKDLGPENAPTLRQIKLAMSLGLNPVNAYKYELSERIREVLADQTEANVLKSRKRQLLDISPGIPQEQVEEMSPQEVVQSIEDRESELCAQFPIGSFVEGDTFAGVLTQYTRDGEILRFGITGNTKGRGTNFNLMNLLTAKLLPAISDAHQAMPAFNERIAETVKKTLYTIEGLDVGQMIPQVTRRLVYKYRQRIQGNSGFHPDNVTDAELLQEIEKQLPKKFRGRF
ncbi:MAG: hypothetical protein ABL890_00190 [Candidatus Peribacteraceae bacterium]